MHVTATKNVDLLREILEEKAQNPNNLQSAPTANLFPNYPSQQEKYREQLNYALLIAISNNSCEMVDLLLSAGAGVSQFNEWYPLVISAVDHDNAELLKLLMKHGSDPNASRHDGSGLHAIARKATPSVEHPCSSEVSNTFRHAEILLEAGADVNLKSKLEGSTPLHEAVRYGHIQAVEYFLNKGADVNMKDETAMRTPLHWAASAGNIEIAKILIDKGADLLAGDKDSNVPWMLAMKNNFGSLARLLCSFHDVNITDSRDRTPLHAACTAGCEQSAEILLKEGANFNAVDKFGNTPLIEAANGKCKIVELLLTRPHINVNHQNNDGLAAIHRAVNKLANTTPNPDLGVHDKYSKSAMKTVNLLCAKGADVNMLNGNGEALVVNHTTNPIVFNRLVEAGATLNTVNRNGENVLTQAVVRDCDDEQTEFTELILNSNSDVERLSRTVYNNLTPLQYAISRQNTHLVKLLINSGAETSHLTAWLNNDESGKAAFNEMPNDVKILIDSRTKCIDLMEMARSAVLRQMGHKNVPEKIKELMIPRSLQKFLDYKVYFSWRSEQEITFNEKL